MTYEKLPININGQIYSPCENCEPSFFKKCSSCDYFISRQILARILYKKDKENTCKYHDYCDYRQTDNLDNYVCDDDCFEQYDFGYSKALDYYDIKIKTPNVLIGTVEINEQDQFDGIATCVSIKPFYTHPKGWFVLRPVNKIMARKIRVFANSAYRNTNLVYDMNNCLEVIKNGIHATEKTGCNASTLIRAIIEEALNIELPDFTTASMCNVLEDSGYFQKHFKFKSLEKTPLEVGDILVTQTKGNCVYVLNVEWE